MITRANKGVYMFDHGSEGVEDKNNLANQESFAACAERVEHVERLHSLQSTTD
jgi:hypothetical protein